MVTSGTNVTLPKYEFDPYDNDHKNNDEFEVASFIGDMIRTKYNQKPERL